MPAKLIPASDWNAASFSPPLSAQALAGHKIAQMTSVYRDVRGDEWVKVKV